MTETRPPAPVIWIGELKHIASLWPASIQTWDARVSEDSTLTLTHNDGTTTEVAVGQYVGIRDKRLAVVRPPMPKNGAK